MAVHTCLMLFNTTSSTMYLEFNIGFSITSFVREDIMMFQCLITNYIYDTSTGALCEDRPGLTLKFKNQRYMEIENKIILSMSILMTIGSGIGMFYNPFLGLFFACGIILSYLTYKEIRHERHLSKRSRRRV